MSFFTYSPCETGRKGRDAHILFHANESEWVKVNDTGLEIAQYLDEGASLDEVTRRLCAEYGISEDAARQDVLSVSDQLFRQHFLDGNARERPARFPVLKSLFLHLTTRCNLSCLHCYMAGSQANSNRDIPSERVFRIIDSLADHGGTSVTLSGGEVLLHPEIKKILQHAASKVKIELSTNGTLIDREWAKFLSDMDIRIQISIDGSTREIHDSIRGNGAFEKSLRAIEYLQVAGLGEKLILATTKMWQNIDDLPAIISLGKRLGVRLVRFMPLRREGSAGKHWDSVGSGVSIADYERFYEYTFRLQRSGQPGIDVNCGLSGFLPKMPEKYKTDDIWCPIGTLVVITVNGDAYPCVLMMKDEFRLGNVFDDSLDKIIQSDAMISVCQALAERRNKIKKCSVCNWRNLCQAGCMGQALDNKGTIWDTDDFCDYRSKAYEEAFDRILNIDD
ncbi:MAG: hypothetical protein C4B58_14150 [Deltaproteobacteria bacterium]|nr:MAG: hypothetical protein C4B58_14150 [Deltaproteobacteria bacterium]